MRARGGRVFLDLKLHDIPETVARAVAAAARNEAELLTVHTSGGYEMLSRAAEAAAGKVKILGVTVLTSLAEDDLRAEGIEQTIPEMVRARARIAARAGHLGAGLLAARDRGGAGRGPRACSSSSPASARRRAPARPRAIRSGSRRAAQAIAAGADYLVVGRPMRDARRSGGGVRGSSEKSQRRSERRGVERSASRGSSSASGPSSELVPRPPATTSTSSTSPTGTRAPEIERVVQAAKERRVSVEFRPRQMVAELAGGGVHQGIVAIAGRFRYAELERSARRRRTRRASRR